MKTRKKKPRVIERLVQSLAGNWVSKLLSLLIAIAVWFTIFTHLDKSKQSQEPPVPGTVEQIPIPKTPANPGNGLIAPQPVIPGN